MLWIIKINDRKYLTAKQMTARDFSRLFKGDYSPYFNERKLKHEIEAL